MAAPIGVPRRKFTLVPVPEVPSLPDAPPLPAPLEPVPVPA